MKSHASELLCCWLFLAFTPEPIKALDVEVFFKPPDDKYLQNLNLILTEIAFTTAAPRCFVIMTDEGHQDVYDQHFFRRSSRMRPFYYLKVNDSEDLLAPNYQTVKMLKQIRSSQCELYFVTILNGVQLRRLLQFVEKNRILSLQRQFVFLYDNRLIEAEMLSIWTNMISSLFLRFNEAAESFSIFTVAYPNILNGKFVVLKRLLEWRKGRKVPKATIFPWKTANLQGFEIPVAVFAHVPMVMFDDKNPSSFRGLEIEILKTLAKAMNFVPQLYETEDAKTERWGRELPNGSYSGLLGQMISRNAKIAIGDLHLYELYTNLIDFSWPHSLECLTFLTPESSQDNSWKTLILPFSGGMWAGVLLSLFAVGTIFYSLSSVHALLLRNKSSAKRQFFTFFRRQSKVARRPVFTAKTFRSSKFRSQLNRMRVKPKNEDLFDSFPNCILYTYSMLLYVSLPRMPLNWPLRVLTGWYWIYCLLLTVTYRASFTAILANPAPRITIDSLDELRRSRLTTSAWGKENKILFEDTFDTTVQEIGANLEITTDIEGVTKSIADGKYAYYDNTYYLRHLRASREGRGDNEVLHIMRDCVIQMPSAIGLERNSPLKKQIDKHIMRMQEAGLIDKWLRDATQSLKIEEPPLPEALMDLHKFWSSFVALAIGYFLSVFVAVAEKWHFEKVVRKHPLYEEHNPKLYYNFKRRYPDVA